jgi:hypothetical protein
VDIDATAGADGVLDVFEQRAFDFDGTFNGVYWDLAEGASEFSDVTVEVLEAGVVEAGECEPLRLSDESRPPEGSYSVRDVGSDSGVPVKRVMLASRTRNDAKAFYVHYRIAGVVARWADTGELYWKYVSDGWSSASRNVQCVVHLPVPAGVQVVPGETVRIWQHHAPLTGEVWMEGNDIVCTVPEVSTRDFAELRAAFPQEWLAQMDAKPEARLDTILAQEDAWTSAAEANHAAWQARAYVLLGSLAALAVALFGMTIAKRRAYKRSHEAVFKEKYWRDVPGPYHPAVLDFIWDNEAGGQEALTASLMHLEHNGAIRLEKLPGDEYRLVNIPEVSGACEHPVDIATVDLFFRKVGLYARQMKGAEHAAYKEAKPKATAGILKKPDPQAEAFVAAYEAKMEALPASGEVAAYLDFADMKEVAKEYPEKYRSWMKEWTEAVERMVAYAGEALRALGYKPYYLYRQKYMSGSFENVGWSRDGLDCLYNIYMMEELHTILSLGGGGMNKVNFPDGRLQRFHNPKFPEQYIEQLDSVLRQKEELFALMKGSV